MSVNRIILVRHGQYTPKSESSAERLTKLGREQAKFVGKRLNEENIKRIISSSMPRALETSQIIRAHLINS